MVPICFSWEEWLNRGWMISNITYLGHHVTSHDLDLRSNFNIDPSRSTCIYFDAFRREEHDDAQIMSQVFLVQKVFAKKHCLQKKRFLDPLLDQFWRYQRKSSKKAIECFFFAPFYLHTIGSEIMTRNWSWIEEWHWNEPRNTVFLLFFTFDDLCWTQ